MAKTTVELNEELTQDLEDLSRAQGTTKAQVLRRSIALLKYLQDADQIKVRTKDGTEKEVVIA